MLETTPMCIDRETAAGGFADGNISGESQRSRREALLIEAVRQALCGVGHWALRDLEIEVSNGVVLLWGRVPTYYQKQLAQATVQRVDGVCGVANALEVVCPR